MRRFVVLSFVAALVAPGVAAQSLAEAAAKERERRKGQPTKVIDEYALKHAGTGPAGANVSPSGPEPAPSASPATSGSSATAAKPGATKEKTEDEIRAEQEAAWREKLQKANADVAALTKDVERLQAGLNDVSGVLYSASRTNLLNEFEASKAKLQAAQQLVADLQEEGRRNRYR